MGALFSRVTSPKEHNCFQRPTLKDLIQGVTSEAACSGKPPGGSGRNLALQLRHWIGQKLPKFKLNIQAILQDGVKPRGFMEACSCAGP